jgi:hypothetical protein
MNEFMDIFLFLIVKICYNKVDIKFSAQYAQNRKIGKSNNLKFLEH